MPRWLVCTPGINEKSDFCFSWSERISDILHQSSMNLFNSVLSLLNRGSLAVESFLRIRCSFWLVSRFTATELKFTTFLVGAFTNCCVNFGVQSFKIICINVCLNRNKTTNDRSFQRRYWANSLGILPPLFARGTFAANTPGPGGAFVSEKN